CRLLVELFDGHADVIGRDVHLTGLDDRLGVGQLARHPLHVAEFAQSGPAFVLAPPGTARSEPDGERLSKILVGMLLRVPAFDMPDEVFAEWDRAVVVAIGAEE